MGSDLRTSARDLLSLAHKVNVLLQRHSDKLHGDIDSDDTSAEIETVTELRQRVWETSKSLKSALDHVEDIEDEGEPRILREAMDALQIPVREALQIASDSDSKGLSSGHNSPPVSTVPARQYLIPGAFATPTTTMAPSTPPSVHRHPLGLFSTSPKFTAQSPFASPARPSSASRLSSTVAPLSPSPTSTISPPSPASLSPPSNLSKHGGISAAIITSNFTPVTDGPLSIATAPVPVSALLSKSTRNQHPDSTSSSMSSTASFFTPITSPLDRPLSPIRNQTTVKSKTDAGTKEPSASTPKQTIPTVATQSSQPRRVPRGLFSMPSTPGSGFDPLSSKRTLEIVPTSAKSVNGHHSQPAPVHALPTVSPAQALAATSKPHNGTVGPSSLHSPTRPETPLQSPLTETSPTAPLTPFTAIKSPTSPHPLHRSQPKPSPIQTSPPQGSTPQRPRTTREDDDGVSQLARDLESAMNPTPTEPVPQPYFLQGKGLLQRIPSQVSMDDGLLNDHQDFEGQLSEESENEGDLSGAQGLSRGGLLRRQRSGGKRRFRMTRSRSRNRSKGRLESNKPALMPIEVGYPSVLTSSDWPFDKSPPSQTLLDPLSGGGASGGGHRDGRSPRSPPSTPGLDTQPGTSESSATRLLSQINGQQQYHHQQQVQKHQYHVQQLQQQNHSRQTSTASMQSSKFRAGPHLPFADSVTIGSPIRVGRGIGSFTVYSITLTLCDPAVASTALETLRANRRAGSLSLGSCVVERERVSRHLTEAAGSVAGQASSSLSSSLSTSHASGGLEPPRTRASMAAQMMTRSLSFPELGYSAERLLMGIQPMEGHRTPGTTSHKQYHSDGGPQHQQQKHTQATAATTTSVPQRVIHVRKRYSDFVTLRAHLIETFKDRQRLNIFAGRSKQSSRNLSSAAPPPHHRVRAQNSQPITSDEDEEEADEDEDESEEVNEGYLNVGALSSHSRRYGNNSMSNDSSSDSQWIATDSIIRGLPKLPPKRVVGKFRPAFVEKRRRELEYFLEWVVAHPVIGDCPVVVQWFLGESQ